MPIYVIDKITTALNSHKKTIEKSKILILGVAYKKDVDDLRESSAIKIIHLLQKKGAKLMYHDPYIPEINVEKIYLKSVNLSDNLLQNSDCVLITTDHSYLDYKKIAQKAKLIVDTRNAIKDRSFNNVIRL